MQRTCNEINGYFHVHWMSLRLVPLPLTGINLTVFSRVAVITHTGPIATVGVGAVPVQAITVCRIQTWLVRRLFCTKIQLQSYKAVCDELHSASLEGISQKEGAVKSHMLYDTYKAYTFTMLFNVCNRNQRRALD